MSHYQFESPEEAIRKLRREVSQYWNKNKKMILPGAAVLGALLVGFTLVYTVQPDEEAVVLRFGKYVGTNSPGLHFKVPLGVDRVYKVRTQEVKQEEFGFRTGDVSGERTAYMTRGFDKESLILTGDLNVAEVSWVVQYRISEPEKYLFNAKQPVRTIRDVSEAIMRRVVGDRLVSDVLTIGRAEIAHEARELMQEVLDRYDIGIRVVGVKLQDVNPPTPVQASYNEVNAAKQQQESMINVAEREYNRVIPAARGQAEQLISEAEGYALAAVNRAQGDADRFNAVLVNYRLSPGVNRKRLYLETMERLLKSFDHVTIVDDKVKGLIPIHSGHGLRLEQPAATAKGSQ